MRRILVIATLALGLQVGAARAGVYGRADPLLNLPPLGLNYKDIRLVLDPLRLAQAFPVVDQAPDTVKRLAAELEAKRDPTPADRVLLAAYYLRLGRRAD